MPKKTGLALIFDSFVADLGKIVKERVGEAVEAATKEFFHPEKAPKAAPEEKKDKPKRRGRRPGRHQKAVVEAKAAPAPKPKAKSVKKSAPKPKIAAAPKPAPVKPKSVAEEKQAESPEKSD